MEVVTTTMTNQKGESHKKTFFALLLIITVIVSFFFLRYFINFLDYLHSHVFFSIILILVGISFFLFSYWYYKDLFSPLGIFGGIWFMTLGITSMRLSGLQREWSFTAWFVFLGSALCFIVGILISSPLVKNINFKGENSPVDIQWTRKRFYFAIWALFILGTACFVLEAVKAEGGIPLFAKHKTYAYSKFGISFVHYVTVSLMLMPVLAYAYINRYVEKGKKNLTKLILIFMGFAGFFMMFSMLAKQLFIMSILSMIIAINYFRKKKIGIIVLLVVFLFLFVLGIVSQEVRFASNVLVRLGRMNLPENYYFMAMPYLYIATSYENMNSFIEENEPFKLTLGKKVFQPLYVFTLTKYVFKNDFYEDDASGKEHLVEEAFNVSTYLHEPFQDYGVVGTFVFPFICGFLSQLIYLWVRKKNTLYSIMVYSIIVTCLSLTFFANQFSNSTNWFFIFVLTIFHLFCKSRKNTGNREKEMAVV